MVSEADAATQIELEFDGGVHELELAVPLARRDLALHLPDCLDPRGERAIRRYGSMIAAFVRSIDGEPLSTKLRARLADDPALRAALFVAREHLYDRHRFRGRCWLTCPHCQRGMSELDLIGLSIALGVDPWPLRAGSGPNLPFLATYPEHVVRRPGAWAAAAHFILPSRIDAPPNTSHERRALRALDGDREARAWREWSHDGRDLEPGKAHWRYQFAGFRAALRLALAAPGLGPAGGPTTPDAIEALPAPDVYFLDALYQLLFAVDVDAPERATVHCPECGRAFLTALQAEPALGPWPPGST